MADNPEVEPASTDDESPQVEAGDAEPSPMSEGLDPVDLALLMRAQRPSGSDKTASRYVALVVVIVLFAVLMGVGVWLVSHVHTTGTGTNGTIGLPPAHLAVFLR
jgi:hypothetical protein